MYLAHLKVDSKKIQKSVFRNFRPIHRPEPVESLPVSRPEKVMIGKKVCLVAVGMKCKLFGVEKA